MEVHCKRAWVHHHRHLEANTGKMIFGILDETGVARLALGEEEKLIKKLKCSC